MLCAAGIRVMLGCTYRLPGSVAVMHTLNLNLVCPSLAPCRGWNLYKHTQRSRARPFINALDSASSVYGALLKLFTPRSLIVPTQGISHTSRWAIVKATVGRLAPRPGVHLPPLRARLCAHIVRSASFHKIYITRILGRAASCQAGSYR